MGQGYSVKESSKKYKFFFREFFFHLTFIYFPWQV
jgi:hypothetical protein